MGHHFENVLTGVGRYHGHYEILCIMHSKWPSRCHLHIYLGKKGHNVNNITNNHRKNDKVELLQELRVLQGHMYKDRVP